MTFEFTRHLVWNAVHFEWLTRVLPPQELLAGSTAGQQSFVEVMVWGAFRVPEGHSMGLQDVSFIRLWVLKSHSSYREISRIKTTFFNGICLHPLSQISCHSQQPAWKAGSPGQKPTTSTGSQNWLEIRSNATLPLEMKAFSNLFWDQHTLIFRGQG